MNIKRIKLVVLVAFAYQSAIAQFDSTINLSSLDGTNGFTLNGGTVNEHSGRTVSTAGDVNGDGIDDLVIGAIDADTNGNSSGESYVVFGTTDGFLDTIDLADIGASGLTLSGVAANDLSGFSVSTAGDVNGDGIDDLVIGAPDADPNGDDSGSSYVVFGNSTVNGFPSTINLSDLDGTNGFTLNGVAANDLSGFSVSAAGDVNGDGVDDLIIGAPDADPNGDDSGSSYVVFGNSTVNGFPTTINLSDLDGINGFTLNGIAASDRSGFSVSAAGDVNGDGIDDLIIGAPIDDLIIDAPDADTNGDESGSSYVVFGNSTVNGFPTTINLSDLDGTNGFTLSGVAANDLSGFSVSTAGDVNGDGVDDLIIGAPDADPNGDDSGSSYVVFGNSTVNGFPTTINLSDLDGINGFTLNGIAASDRSGFSVSAAGDVNGDGIDDLIIGATETDANGTNAGSGYVVFGDSTVNGFPTTIDLSGLDGTNGFTLNGVAASDGTGFSVSAAGDVNGDGVDDLIIGAPDADPNINPNAGSSYVVFGDDGIFADDFDNDPLLARSKNQ